MGSQNERYWRYRSTARANWDDIQVRYADMLTASYASQPKCDFLASLSLITRGKLAIKFTAATGGYLVSIAPKLMSQEPDGKLLLIDTSSIDVTVTELCRLLVAGVKFVDLTRFASTFESQADEDVTF